MKRAAIVCFSILACAAIAVAQTVPGHYIIQLQSDPATRVSAARHARYSAADADVIARRTQIRAEQAPIEQAVVAAGGRVLAHYDTVLNGMAVVIPDSAAAQLRSLPGVRSVTPVRKVHKALDTAVKVNRITDAWNAIAGGQPSAGAGIKIGILDTGVDVRHPGFQGFTTPIPSGFPIACDYSVDNQGNIGGTCSPNPAESANTDNKVIVSRDYTGEGGGDNDGHGTGVAMIASGLTNNAIFDVLLSDGVTLLPITLSPITGVAPAAWLGAYKVLGSNGGSDEGVLLGLDDAANDGMQVVNLSLGEPSFNMEDETSGTYASAISNLVAAGIVVVVAAGDDGFSGTYGLQAPSTIDLPAVTSDALAVGAVGNGRAFDYGVTVSGLAPVDAALPDVSEDLNFPDILDPVQAPLLDVTKLDPTGLACSALPNNSLTNKVVLIFRGTCTFDTKLNNAYIAGAVGAIVADNKSEALFAMSLSTAVLPALLVSQGDGQNIQVAADAGGASAYLDFGSITPFAADPNTIAFYSPAGPTSGGNIKPDMMAVGGQPINWVNDDAMYADFGNYPYYTGAQVMTALSTVAAAQQGLNDPYQIASGTSFSAPLVTGSAALLMAARPGLTAQQYKSLLINSAPVLVVCDDASPTTTGVCFDGTTPYPALIQNSGSGNLDLLGALNNDLAAAPSSLNFGSSSAASVNTTIPVTFTNVGAGPDTFTVAVNPIDGNLSPSVDTQMFSLAPGQTQTIKVTMAGSNLSTGYYYDGNVAITASQTSVVTNLPYWFGIPGTSVYDIVLLNQNDLNGGYAPRSEVAIFVRYTDMIGMPIAGPAPTVTVPGTAGRVLSMEVPGDIPGTWEIDVRLDSGLLLGYDEFDVTVGGLQPLQVFIPIN